MKKTKSNLVSIMH